MGLIIPPFLKSVSEKIMPILHVFVWIYLWWFFTAFLRVLCVNDLPDPGIETLSHQGSLYIYVCIYTYIYIYVYIHIHTYIHIGFAYFS